jgi:hypothetical protein
MARSEFSSSIKQILSARVGALCSLCGAPTFGPSEAPRKFMILGEAAHISGESPGGPRYDATMTDEARGAIANGIWLCATCHTKVDSDHVRFSIDYLRHQKALAELRAEEVAGKAVLVAAGASVAGTDTGLSTLVTDVGARFVELTDLRNITPEAYEAKGLPDALTPGGDRVWAAMHMVLPYLSEATAETVVAIVKALDAVALVVGVRPRPDFPYDPLREAFHEERWGTLTKAYSEYLTAMRIALGVSRPKGPSTEDRLTVERTIVSVEQLAAELAGLGSVLASFGPSAPADANPRKTRIARQIATARSCEVAIGAVVGPEACESFLGSLDDLENRLASLFARVETEVRREGRAPIGDPTWRQTFGRAEEGLNGGAARLRHFAKRLREGLEDGRE